MFRFSKRLRWTLAFRIPKHQGGDVMTAGTSPREAPRPGRPVRGSTTGRPLMAALDLLGRRWTLRILWELRDGPVGFRDLQARCDAMSPSVLHQRLNELEEHRL